MKMLHEPDKTSTLYVPLQFLTRIFGLVGLEGMSYDEAAKIIHVPIGTIRSRLARAREALRLLMGIDEETGCGRRVTQRSPTLRVGLAA